MKQRICHCGVCKYCIIGPCEQIEKLNEQKKILVEYLKSKLEIEDWHGISDAANDIREIEAQIKVWVLGWYDDGI